MADNVARMKGMINAYRRLVVRLKDNVQMEEFGVDEV